MKVNDLIICEASCSEHQMIFKYDSENPDWGNVYISYHLENVSFWNRIKYLFGFKTRYGAFGEIILSADDPTIEKFENVIKHLKLVQKHEKKREEEMKDKS